MDCCEIWLVLFMYYIFHYITLSFGLGFEISIMFHILFEVRVETGDAGRDPDAAAESRKIRVQCSTLGGNSTQSSLDSSTV